MTWIPPHRCLAWPLCLRTCCLASGTNTHICNHTCTRACTHTCKTLTDSSYYLHLHLRPPLHLHSHSHFHPLMCCALTCFPFVVSLCLSVFGGFLAPIVWLNMVASSFCAHCCTNLLLSRTKDQMYYMCLFIPFLILDI